MSEPYITVGKIVNTHGIKGELKIVSQSDFPEIRFSKKAKLIAQHPDTKAIEQLVIETVREHKGSFIIQFQGFTDINQVEKLKGWALKVPEAERVVLQPDEFYYRDIIGCSVVSDEGQTIGTITEILTPGANDVWVVTPADGGKAVLIPYIDDIVLKVDVKQKRVLIHAMEGLL